MRTQNGFLRRELSLPSGAALAYAAAAVGFALVSLAVTGFRFSSNNVFHIPYVLDLASRPEFADDAFYASLEFFTSVVWPPLRLVASESNLPALFEGVHLLGRVLAFAGLVFLLRANGLRAFLPLATALAALAVASLLRGMSLVGVHDMLPDYLTHTGLTWGFVFFALGLLQMRKHAASAALTGVVFAINAFVGAWLLLISVCVLCFERSQWTWRSLALAAAAFLLFASPALAWIALAVASARQAGDGAGSYLEYIRLYFPNHFLIEAAGARKLAGLACLHIVGFLAARHLAAARFWTLVQVACLLIFLVGIPLPYLWDNRLLLNLHLLRSDGIEQAVAVILAAMAGVKLLADVHSPARQLAGAIVLLSIAVAERGALNLLPMGFALAAALVAGTAVPGAALPRPVMLACVCALAIATFHQIADPAAVPPIAVRLVLAAGLLALALAQRLPALREPDARPTLARALLPAMLVTSLATSASAASRRIETASQIEPAARSWRELTAWIRNSDIHGTFLVPLNPRARDSREWLDWFQLEARRPVWVDWKQGAAAMWWPPFQGQWMERYLEVSALRSPEQFVAYASSKGVQNVVIETETGTCPRPSTRIKATAHYVFCRLTPASNG